MNALGIVLPEGADPFGMQLTLTTQVLLDEFMVPFYHPKRPSSEANWPNLLLQRATVSGAKWELYGSFKQLHTQCFTLKQSRSE